MHGDSNQTLTTLTPLHKTPIMDVVRDAGIDVAGWAMRTDGRSVREPASNPQFCYEWAFGGGDEPVMLCVWHRDLSVASEQIEYRDSLRQLAFDLDRVTWTPGKTPSEKNRARDQAKRARKFDLLVQQAYRKSKPVRLALLQGDQRASGKLGQEASSVRYRKLDAALWYIHAYNDDDGQFLLVRNVPVPTVEHASTERGPDVPSKDQTDLVVESVRTNKSAAQDASVKFIDQFDLVDIPNKQDVCGSVYVRSRDVRRNVLSRAQGKCEYCEQPGFLTEHGAIFLETHHVIPLSERGADQEWNVMALCPDDHRKAHYSTDKAAMQQQMLAKLATIETEPQPGRPRQAESVNKDSPN